MSVLERPLRLLAGSPLARAATWPHGVDGFAGVLDTAWSSRSVRARIAGLRRQTDDTVTLTLRPNGNWAGHRAGQHVLLTVEVDGVRQSRCFSVASAPGDPTLELTCKVGPASTVARHLREHAAPGDVVELSQAQGDFVLDPAAGDHPILLVGAGSGITPVLSMLRALDRGDDAGAGARQVTFVHYARTGRDVLYAPEVAAIVARHPGWRALTVTEHDDTGDLVGRFGPDHLAAADLAPPGADAYVCGPQPFMDAVAAAWQHAGGDAARFHTESYGAPPAPAGGPAGGTLRFARSGVEVANDGRSILEQAEAAGIRPAHGCRRGICHTCVVPRAAGCVRTLTDGSVEAGPADVAGTPVRICITAPDGDVELDL